jgi:phosphoribosylformylglycinamidine synthase PurS subunit
MLKPGLLDPQGRAVERTIQRLGTKNVKEMRIGKRIELLIEGDRDDVETQLEGLARDVLSNPITEDYRIQLSEI